MSDGGGDAVGARSTVVVDDAADFRALVGAVLSPSVGFRVVGEGGSGAEAVRLAERYRPELLLLDLSMPGMDGLEALPLVRRASPDTRVVMLSGFAPEGGPAEAALTAGAAGYIDKGGLVVELPARLKALLAAGQPAPRAAQAGGQPSPRAAPAAAPAAALDARAAVDPAALELVAAEHAERFREFFETAAIGMALLTLSLRVVRANARLGELSGRERRELVGTPYAQLAHADDAGQLERELATLCRGQRRRVELEHRLAPSRAGERWVLATAAAVADARGAPLYLFVQAHDISARKRAEQRLELQATVAEMMREGVILVRASDRGILYTNRAFDAMFGYRRGALAGRDLLTLHPPPGAPAEHTVGELIGELARSGGKLRNRRADGSEFWTRASVTAFEHADHGLLWVAVHTELGERAQG